MNEQMSTRNDNDGPILQTFNYARYCANGGICEQTQEWRHQEMRAQTNPQQGFTSSHSQNAGQMDCWRQTNFCQARRISDPSVFGLPVARACRNYSRCQPSCKQRLVRDCPRRGVRQRSSSSDDSHTSHEGEYDWDYSDDKELIESSNILENRFRSRVRPPNRNAPSRRGKCGNINVVQSRETACRQVHMSSVSQPRCCSYHPQQRNNRVWFSQSTLDCTEAESSSSNTGIGITEQNSRTSSKSKSLTNMSGDFVPPSAWARSHNPRAFDYEGCFAPYPLLEYPSLTCATGDLRRRTTIDAFQGYVSVDSVIPYDDCNNIESQIAICPYPDPCTRVHPNCCPPTSCCKYYDISFVTNYTGTEKNPQKEPNPTISPIESKIYDEAFPGTIETPPVSPSIAVRDSSPSIVVPNVPTANSPYSSGSEVLVNSGSPSSATFTEISESEEEAESETEDEPIFSESIETQVPLKPAHEYTTPEKSSPELEPLPLSYSETSIPTEKTPLKSVSEPTQPNATPTEKPSNATPTEKPSNATPTEKSSQPNFTPTEKSSQPNVTLTEKPSQPNVTPAEKPSNATPTEKPSQPSFTPTEKSSQPNVTLTEKPSQPNVTLTEKPSSIDEQPLPQSENPLSPQDKPFTIEPKPALTPESTTLRPVKDTLTDKPPSIVEKPVSQAEIPQPPTKTPKTPEEANSLESDPDEDKPMPPKIESPLTVKPLPLEEESKPVNDEPMPVPMNDPEPSDDEPTPLEDEPLEADPVPLEEPVSEEESTPPDIESEPSEGRPVSLLPLPVKEEAIHSDEPLPIPEYSLEEIPTPKPVPKSPEWQNEEEPEQNLEPIDEEPEWQEEKTPSVPSLLSSSEKSSTPSLSLTSRHSSATSSIYTTNKSSTIYSSTIVSDSLPSTIADSDEVEPLPPVRYISPTVSYNTEITPSLEDEPLLPEQEDEVPPGLMLRMPPAPELCCARTCYETPTPVQQTIDLQPEILRDLQHHLECQLQSQLNFCQDPYQSDPSQIPCQPDSAPDPCHSVPPAVPCQSNLVDSPLRQNPCQPDSIPNPCPTSREVPNQADPVDIPFQMNQFQFDISKFIEQQATEPDLSGNLPSPFILYNPHRLESLPSKISLHDAQQNDPRCGRHIPLLSMCRQSTSAHRPMGTCCSITHVLRKVRQKRGVTKPLLGSVCGQDWVTSVISRSFEVPSIKSQQKHSDLSEERPSSINVNASARTGAVEAFSDNNMCHPTDTLASKNESDSRECEIMRSRVTSAEVINSGKEREISSYQPYTGAASTTPTKDMNVESHSIISHTVALAHTKPMMGQSEEQQTGQFEPLQDWQQLKQQMQEQQYQQRQQQVKHDVVAANVGPCNVTGHSQQQKQQQQQVEQRSMQQTLEWQQLKQQQLELQSQKQRHDWQQQQQQQQLRDQQMQRQQIGWQQQQRQQYGLEEGTTQNDFILQRQQQQEREQYIVSQQQQIDAISQKLQQLEEQQQQLAALHQRRQQQFIAQQQDTRQFEQWQNQTARQQLQHQRQEQFKQVQQLRQPEQSNKLFNSTNNLQSLPRKQDNCEQSQADRQWNVKQEYIYIREQQQQQKQQHRVQLQQRPVLNQNCMRPLQKMQAEPKWLQQSPHEGLTKQQLYGQQQQQQQQQHRQQHQIYQKGWHQYHNFVNEQKNVHLTSASAVHSAC